MCLILLAIDQHPEFPFVLAANRDEFYQRPTAAATFWKEKAGLLAGRDLKAGGTWLGVTRAGRIAAVTNLREPPRHEGSKPSRGTLTIDYLAGNASAGGYMATVQGRREEFDGFNFFAGTLSGIPPQADLFFLNSRDGQVRQLDPGIHGISNGPLDAPWPKVERGRARLREVLQEPAGLLDPRTRLLEGLFGILSDRTAAPDAELPDTGVGLEIERMLSPIFVHGEEYGTRSSTVLLLGADGGVYFEEWTWNPEDGAFDRSVSRFRIQS